MKILDKTKHVLTQFIKKSDSETSKKVRNILRTITPVKWCLFLGVLILPGIYLCKATSYSVPMFFIVFIGLNSISTISIFSEHKFIQDINQFESELLGQSENYFNNQKVGALLAKYSKTWNISGDVLLKALLTVIFFSIIGIGLMGKYPPNMILAFFLLLFAIAVCISMIGYFQYEALYGFVLELPDIYIPSNSKFFWVTQKRYIWVTRLARLYDFYSTIFFSLALIYTLGCFIFCFHKDFGVMTSSKTIAKTTLLIIFWLKILFELVFKFVYKLYHGKKKITDLEKIIKDNCLNIVQNKFDDPVQSEKDYEGFNLYLQLQQISIVPKTSQILNIARAVIYVANTLVTFSSVYTLFTQTF